MQKNLKIIMEKTFQSGEKNYLYMMNLVFLTPSYRLSAPTFSKRIFVKCLTDFDKIRLDSWIFVRGNSIA